MHQMLFEHRFVSDQSGRLDSLAKFQLTLFSVQGTRSRSLLEISHLIDRRRELVIGSLHVCHKDSLFLPIVEVSMKPFQRQR
jgi:hypothetical protein